MAKVNLPPGCAGFADGNDKYLAVRGPGSYVNLDPADPKDALALKKLKNQDYASAGLVDAGPEKLFVRDTRKQGRWCRNCLRLWHAWAKTCSKCGDETIPECEMEMPAPPKGIHGEIII